MRMTRAVICCVVVFGAIPTLAQAPTTPAPVPKPTIADVNKVVQGIKNDKAKQKTYCDMAKLNEQMEAADAKGDTKALEALGAKADQLTQALGPEYAKLMDGLEQVDENSAEGKAMAAAFDSLDQECK